MHSLPQANHPFIFLFLFEAVKVFQKQSALTISENYSFKETRFEFGTSVAYGMNSVCSEPDHDGRNGDGVTYVKYTIFCDTLSQEIKKS
jgi:hypothetical protein